MCAVTHDRVPARDGHRPEIGMRACAQAFDHLRISKARKHDNSAWSIHTRYVNDDDDDDEDDQLSMSFVICLEEGQLVVECIVSASGLCL